MLEPPSKASAPRPLAKPVRRSSPSRPSAKHHLEPNPFEKSFSSEPSHDGSDRKTDIKSDHSRNLSNSTPPLSTRPGAAYRDRTHSASKSQTSPSASNDATSTPKPLLPPVASITSPANETSQYPWAASLTSSLRSGPLSPAMLAGPQSANFDPNSFRTGFTPDLSNFKTGLTPLGGGPISFPPPSPNTAAFLAAMVNNTSAASTSAATITPNTLSALSGNPPAPGADTTSANVSSQPQGFPERPIDSNDTFDLAFGKTFGADKQGSKLKDSVVINGDPNASKARPVGTADRQQANQAASGLFLLSQAQQEISRREDADAQQQQMGMMNPSTSLYESSNSSVGKGTKNSKANKAANASAAKRKKDAEEAKSSGTASKKAKNKKGATDAAASSKKKGHTEGEDDDDDMDSGDDSDDEQGGRKSDGKGGGDDKGMDEKRKNFLERNRQAALKCRQRKKAWLASLQAKVEYLQNDNENLQNTVGALRNEILFLKSQLVQAQGGAPPAPMPVGMGMGMPIGPHHPDPHHSIPQPAMGVPAGMGPHPAYMHPTSGPTQITSAPHQAGIYSAHAVPRPSQMPNTFEQDGRGRPRIDADHGRDGVQDVKLTDQPINAHVKHDREWSNSSDPSKSREINNASIKV